jgi:hypothetical protein
VERSDRDALVLDQALGRRDMAGVDEPPIGHEQRPPELQVAREVPEARDGALAEYDARARLEIERKHLQ